MVITNMITFLSYLAIALPCSSSFDETRRIIAQDWGYFVIGFAAFHSRACRPHSA